MGLHVDTQRVERILETKRGKEGQLFGLALAPGIKAGELETAVFPVWDPVGKRVLRVTAYRQKLAKAVKPVKKG